MLSRSAASPAHPPKGSLMNRSANWIFARAALLILSIVALITWLSFLAGCSVDSQGLSEPIAPLARGAVDTGVTEVVIPNPSDAGTTSQPDVGASTMDDGGAAGADVSPHNIVDALSDGEPNPVADAGHSPSECPISATRSLSVCTATTQLCRYYDTGAPVLMTGCTAEGRLCVKSCP